MGKKTTQVEGKIIKSDTVYPISWSANMRRKRLFVPGHSESKIRTKEPRGKFGLTL